VGEGREIRKDGGGIRGMNGDMGRDLYQIDPNNRHTDGGWCGGRFEHTAMGEGGGGADHTDAIEAFRRLRIHRRL
jgi:hypothetical protein